MCSISKRLFKFFPVDIIGIAEQESPVFFASITKQVDFILRKIKQQCPPCPVNSLIRHIRFQEVSYLVPKCGIINQTFFIIHKKVLRFMQFHYIYRVHITQPGKRFGGFIRVDIDQYATQIENYIFYSS